MNFTELNAHPALLRAIAAHGYEKATPVQASVLAEETKGRDLLVSSETGSGKTVAFGLAMAPELLGDLEKAPRTQSPLALVVAPTRELAQQVQRELWWLYSGADVKVTSCVGGTDMRREQRALQEGPHLVAGTPGRLVDHIDRGSLDLSRLRVVVLDEADEMLDMGFREELERILSAAPVERRTLLFSATIPKEIESLARSYQKDTMRVSATPLKQAHRDIEYRAHLVVRRERDHAVVNVIRQADASSSIVFCSTREGVNHLHANLVERGFAAVALSGELSQMERNRALASLRDGRANVLVATDVAARGLDLPDVGLVVHADLPTNPETMQHRSGRTGRAGRKGISVLLVPGERRRAFERLAYGAHVKVQWLPVPTAEEIKKLDENRLIRDIETQAAESSEEDLAVAKRLLETRPAEQLAAMLVALHRARRPMPEDLPLTGKPGPAYERTPRPVPQRGERTGPPIASPRGEHGEGNGNRWFKISVGREGKADPKWLIPLLCRRGAITKADIGAIRIAADETLVEISARAAERFGLAVRRPDTQDRSIVISPAEEPAQNPWSRPPPRRPSPEGPFKPRAPRPEGGFKPRTGPSDRPARFTGPPSRRGS